jgi:hypothetical protein
MNIREETINKMESVLSKFNFSEEKETKKHDIRNQFKEYFNKDRINDLKKEDYFLGLGKKKGCIAYELEWGTKELGSIKGGSKVKYGYEDDFEKIKSLLKKLISFEDKFEQFYCEDGQFTERVQKICKETKQINGFKTGRTVLPKLLSIYYPNAFLPIFNDADYPLSNILSDYTPDKTGLELYLENNLWLLKTKEELGELEDVSSFSGYKYMAFLYECFPKGEKITVRDSAKITDSETSEPEIEALELHYQTLIHKNFSKLFPTLQYFDEEMQKPKNGHYNTQSVGIMDFLTIEKDTKDFVVIEVKCNTSDQTVGQLARYMGWVKDELCKDGQNVKGLILANKKKSSLDFALKVFPNVKFRKIELNLEIISA